MEGRDPPLQCVWNSGRCPSLEVKAAVGPAGLPLLSHGGDEALRRLDAAIAVLQLGVEYPEVVGRGPHRQRAAPSLGPGGVRSCVFRCRPAARAGPSLSRRRRRAGATAGSGAGSSSRRPGGPSTARRRRRTRPALWALALASVSVSAAAGAPSPPCRGSLAGRRWPRRASRRATRRRDGSFASASFLRATSPSTYGRSM